MAVFKFDEVDQVVRENDNKIYFLKLQDDGWYAELRFMYGPGEMFECQTVHNVSEDPRKPRYVSCLRGLNEPLDSCPLCAKGSKINAQFFIPVFVEAIISNIRGEETRQEVNQVINIREWVTEQHPFPQNNTTKWQIYTNLSCRLSPNKQTTRDTVAM